MLSLVPYNKTLCTESKSLFVIVLLINWIMLHLSKEPNIGQYVQYSTGWQHGCLVGSLPMTHGLSNMLCKIFTHRLSVLLKFYHDLI